MNEVEIKRLLNHCAGIMHSIILPEITPRGCIVVRDLKGGLYEDDVATHHLSELLIQIDRKRFSSIIESVVKWFIKERGDLHNPFFVTTLSHTGNISSENIKNLVEKSILSQKRKSGLIDMYAAFLDGGSIFSTLWAVEILLSTQVRNEYEDIIKTALKAIWNNWDDIHRSSFKGFFLELLLRFEKNDELPDPKIILNEIIREQKDNGLWDESYLYTFYIIGNLTYAANWYSEVIKIVDKSLINLFELNKEVDELPSFIKEIASKYSESLFLQTCMRSIIAADRYLKFNGYGNELSETLTNNIVGTWPTLYYHARLLEARVKERERQYEDIEKEFKHIRQKSRKLLEKSPYSKNIFIMMPLKPYMDGDERYVTLVKQIKNILKKEGYTAWVATDMQLDSTLWNNVAAYLEACKYGIAIFTRREKKEGDKIIEEEYFNPNVSLEIGFMLARGKKVLILKDKMLKQITTDLVGHLYEEFELNKPRQINKIIRRWIREIREKEKEK